VLIDTKVKKRRKKQKGEGSMTTTQS